MNVKDTLQKIVTYLFYGISVCAAILLPWVLTEELLSRVPGATEFVDYIQALGLPTLLTFMLILVGAIVIVLGLGYITKTYLWSYLSKFPLFARFTHSIDRINEQLNNTDPTDTERVVWVAWPTADVQTIGIITDAPTTDSEWVTVALFSTAGQLSSPLIRRIRVDQVTYPNWTIEEALEFVMFAAEQ